MSADTQQTSSAKADDKSGSEKPQPGASQGMQQRWQQLPSEARRTSLFVGVAAGCLLITGLFELASRPAEIQEYGKVGQEFYPDFTDPTVATSLSVKVIDADELKPLEFSVKQAENGRWVIPSHHDYPADAADQLAETASSVIGIKRGAMVTRWASDHPRYGVVDPETDSVSVDEIEGIGKRLTLGGKDTVLASYIIGKKVDDEGNQYYVRHPAEDETYIAELEINLSTKFSDWVETDLLDINNFDVRRVTLNDYSFQERGASLAVTNTVVSTLSRESSSADWTMDGINEETEEVDKDAIRETVNAVCDLKIIGVRPKQPGLTADLKLDQAAVRSQRDVDRLQSDLLSRGFLLQPSESNPDLLRLISREGEMSTGTEDGLVYQLHFGRVFTGSEKELEIGLTNSDSGGEKPTDDGENGSKEGEDGDAGDDEAGGGDDAKDDDSDDADSDSDADSGEEADSGKPGRYVFVRVEFDPNLLGEKPEPVEPEMPEELKQAEQKEEADGESADESEDDAEPGDDDQSGDESSEGDDAEQEESEEEKEKQRLQKLREEYDDAKQKYDDDVKALEEYEEKVTESKKKAEDLNRRFAQWYYVIPGDSYDKLSLSRQDLIKAKEKEEEDGEGEAESSETQSEGPSLNIPQPAAEDAAEPAAEEKDEPEMKQAESPESTAAAEEPETGKQEEEAKPEETKPADSEPEPAKPEADKPAEPEAGEVDADKQPPAEEAGDDEGGEGEKAE